MKHNFAKLISKISLGHRIEVELSLFCSLKAILKRVAVR